MTGNRLSLFALSISISFHVAALAATGGYFANSAREISKLEIKALDVEPEKAFYLPAIELVGEVRQIDSTAKAYSQKEQALKQETGLEAGYYQNENSVELYDEAQEAMLRYQDAIKQRIESCRYYPLRAQQMGMEGTVALTFKIYADGSSADICILESSGSKILDTEAIKTIVKATPFLPLPQTIKSNPVNIRVAIVFSMH